VGFGGDFDGIPSTLSGVEGAEAYPAILARLAERGCGPEDLERIAWRNWTRVLRGALPDGLAAVRPAGIVPSREPAP
jgi:membrane dipeptidase